MSPEQATGEQRIDGRSDSTRSAACSTRCSPASRRSWGPTAASIIARHTMDRVPSLAIVRENVPDELEDVVLQALAKIPADRFKTARRVRRGAAAAEGCDVFAARGGGAQRDSADALDVAGSEAQAPRDCVRRPCCCRLRSWGWGAWHYTRGAHIRSAGESTGLDPRRIAVMYFQDDSKTHDLNYLADGLTEALITRLRAVSGLDVVSTNGAAIFRDSSAPPDSIARALSAGTLVVGSIEPDKDKLRVSVRLKDGTGTASSARASRSRSATPSRFATRSPGGSPNFCGGGWGGKCGSASSARGRRARMHGRCSRRPRSTSGARKGR